MRSAVRRSLLLAALLALAPRAALAQPGTGQLLQPPTPEKPRAGRPAYGVEIFAADAVVAAVALGSGSGGVLLGLGLTGPTVHAVHGEVGSAFASLGLRVGVPFTGALVGFAICGSRHLPGEPEPWFQCQGSAAIGIAAGAAVALGIDYFLLARE